MTCAPSGRYAMVRVYGARPPDREENRGRRPAIVWQEIGPTREGDAVKTHIAWTLALAAGAWAASPAPAQQAMPRGTAPQPAANAAARPPAGGAPSRSVVVPPPAAKRDPAAEKASQEAAIRMKQEMQQILAAWEKKSSQVKSLSVGFDRVDDSPAWGQEMFKGQAMLQSPDLACLHFNKQVAEAEGGKPAKYANDERIVCTGEEVLQYKWDTQQVFIYPLDKQTQQKTLQQGPLPFLFNMKAAETTKRYDMALVGQNDKQYQIRIAPLLEIDRESFLIAELLLNKTTFLPDSLKLWSVNGKDTQKFTFTTVVANQPLDQKFFQKMKLAGWKEVVNPSGGEGQAATAPSIRQAPGRIATPAPRAGQAQRPVASPR